MQQSTQFFLENLVKSENTAKRLVGIEVKTKLRYSPEMFNY